MPPPKAKKPKVSDSESDSGSASDSDREPTPQKDSKDKKGKGSDAKNTSTTSGSTKPKSTSRKVVGESEPTWELGGNKFIKIRDFKGKTYIDIREFYEKDGKTLPGKKGISLNVEQWQYLCSSVNELNEKLNK